MNTQQRVALVTGANRGLGFETTRQLLVRGMTVAMGGRDLAAVEHARRTLGEDGQARTLAVRMDVTNAESIAAAHRLVSERIGAVDVLVNNAAVLLFENDGVLSIPPSGLS
jgi:NAD(P)-dependent dehydrogenase (short-subunit alcohol dehydrogenase family)